MNAGTSEDKNSKNPEDDRNIAVVNGRIDSKNIFIGTREVMINHGDDIYRLRLTAQNKLILTK